LEFWSKSKFIGNFLIFFVRILDKNVFYVIEKIWSKKVFGSFDRTKKNFRNFKRKIFFFEIQFWNLLRIFKDAIGRMGLFNYWSSYGPVAETCQYCTNPWKIKYQRFYGKKLNLLYKGYFHLDYLFGTGIRNFTKNL